VHLGFLLAEVTSESKAADVVIAGLLALVAILIVAVGWFLSRTIHKIEDKIERVDAKFGILKDEIHEANATLHKRISDQEASHRELRGKVDAHLDETRHGRSTK
jgi:hypothetical protein